MTPTNWLYDELLARTSLVAPDFASRPDAEEKIKAFLQDAYDNRHATNFFSFIQRHLRADRSVGEIEQDKLYYELNTFLHDLFSRDDLLNDGGPIEAIHDILGGRLEIFAETATGDLLEGGSILFRNVGGGYTLEHTEGPERNNYEEPEPWDMFQVQTIPLPTDVYYEHNWVKNVTWERRLNGRSINVGHRAAELIRIGEECGWNELDSYPLPFSGRELKLRWEGSDWDDVSTRMNRACTPPDDPSEEYPEIVCEMYQAIAWCDQNKRNFMDFVKQATALRRRAKGNSVSDRGFDWLCLQTIKILNKYGPSEIDTKLEELKGARVYICVEQDLMVGLLYDVERREWIVEQGPAGPSQR